MESYVYSHFID